MLCLLQCFRTSNRVFSQIRLMYFGTFSLPRSVLDFCICPFTQLLSCGIACAVLEIILPPLYFASCIHLHVRVRHSSRVESFTIVECGRSLSFHLRHPGSILLVAIFDSSESASGQRVSGLGCLVQTTLRPVQPCGIATWSSTSRLFNWSSFDRVFPSSAPGNGECVGVQPT